MSGTLDQHPTLGDAGHANAEDRNSDLGRLLEVTRVLAAEIDLTKILTTITGEAIKALDCDRASLYQYDPEKEELYTTVVTELELSEIRKKLGQGISGAAAQQRRLLNVSDPHSDPRWDCSVDQATGYRTRNILAAPLTSPDGQRLLGVLELINKNSGTFSAADEELLSAFSQHAAVALDRAGMVEQLRRQHAVQASLDVARDIQRGFMPRQLPSIEGYSVATWWLPNQAIGGDYCDVVNLVDGRVALVIADVSGHGIGPSLIMASVRAALRALVLQHSAPELLLSLLGRALASDLRDGLFITMLLAAFDAKRHRLEYANAGHAPALHYRAADQSVVPLEASDMPLGVLEATDYVQGQPVSISPGDIILLCTDGVVEAMDADGRQFGQDQLVEIVRREARAPLPDLLRRLGRAVEDHFEGDSPPDDITILALRRES